MRHSALFALALIAGCNVPKPDPNPAPPGPPTPGLFVQELIDAHNKLRLQRGVRPLLPDAHLQAACDAHATDMAYYGFMSHTGNDGSSPFQRMTRFGYLWSSAGENVARGQADVAAVMAAWEGSSGHRRNMLDTSYVNIGAACVASKDGQPYWCVDFGSPARMEGWPGEPKVTSEERGDTSSTRAERP